MYGNIHSIIEYLFLLQDAKEWGIKSLTADYSATTVPNSSREKQQLSPELRALIEQFRFVTEEMLFDQSSTIMDTHIEQCLR
jgi:hypothetical protein